MQIKNNIKLFFVLLIYLFIFFNISLRAEEFNITAKEILIDKENETLTGTGLVEALDSDGNIVNADKITYQKSDEFLLAEGNVKITDKNGNVLLSSKASYDKLNELISANNYFILEHNTNDFFVFKII